jgi:hypothetical protein
MTRQRRFKTTSLVLLPILALSIHAFAEQREPQKATEPTADKLDSAILSLRHIDQAKLSDEEKENKAKEIEDAWTVIRAAGKTGLARVQQEVKSVRASRERDDFFMLNAARLLWLIGRFDQVEEIAAMWNSVPLEAQYQYVFYTAFEAAITQDPRALPLLRACLRDKKGELFVVLHSLDVQWPLTIEFLWGAYGAKGLPVLKGILDISTDPVELASATALLAEAQYAEALPAIRKWAKDASADKSVRSIAIRALGTFGHPQDYSFLVSGLASKEPSTLTDFTYALYEYEDLRAVPLLIPLLKTENRELKQEVTAALIHLISVDSIDALRNDCASKATQQGRDSCLSELGSYLEDLHISLATFPTLSSDAKSALIASIRRSEEEEYALKPGDQKLTRQDFLEVIGDWRRNHRVKSDRFGWAEPRQILAAATPADLELLMDARAAIYGRLSDECLDEVATLDKIIRRLGRSRYRKTVGLTDNNI